MPFWYYPLYSTSFIGLLKLYKKMMTLKKFYFLNNHLIQVLLYLILLYSHTQFTALLFLDFLLLLLRLCNLLVDLRLVLRSLNTTAPSLFNHTPPAFAYVRVFLLCLLILQQLAINLPVILFYLLFKVI